MPNFIIPDLNMDINIYKYMYLYKKIGTLGPTPLGHGQYCG